MRYLNLEDFFPYKSLATSAKLSQLEENTRAIASAVTSFDGKKCADELHRHGAGGLIENLDASGKNFSACKIEGSHWNELFLEYLAIDLPALAAGEVATQTIDPPILITLAEDGSILDCGVVVAQIYFYWSYWEWSAYHEFGYYFELYIRKTGDEIAVKHEWTATPVEALKVVIIYQPVHP